jgi:hypothetical protein
LLPRHSDPLDDQTQGPAQTNVLTLIGSASAGQAREPLGWFNASDLDVPAVELLGGQ